MIYKMPFDVWDQLSERASVDKNGFMQGWLVESYIENTYGLRYTGIVDIIEDGISKRKELYEYEIVDEEKFKNYTMYLLRQT